MLVSIIIVNYNYGAYIRQAIESALGQSHPDVEVIVIDDGSVDDSRSIISEYEDRLHPVFKDNSGQISTCNVGKTLAKGEIVIVLDSDDLLYRDTVARHVEQFRDPSVIKSQGALPAVNSASDHLGYVVPRKLSPSGDYKERFLHHGPTAYNTGFTSGCAWRRSVLDLVFPLPNDDLKIIGPDGYLSSIDPLLGKIASLDGPVGQYRVHDDNRGPFRYSFDVEFLKARTAALERRIQFGGSWARKLGYEVDSDVWTSRSGWRFALARHALALMENRPRVSPFELAASPFKGPGPNTMTSWQVSAVLALVGVLPKGLSLAMTKRMLDKAWTKKKQVTTDAASTSNAGHLRTG